MEIAFFVQSVIESRGRKWRPGDARREILERASLGPMEAARLFLAAKHGELSAHQNAATVAFCSGTAFGHLDVNGLEIEEAAVAISEALELAVRQARAVLGDEGRMHRGKKPDTELTIFVSGLVETAFQAGADLKAPTNWDEGHGSSLVEYVKSALQMSTDRIRNVVARRTDLEAAERQAVMERAAEYDCLTHRAIGERIACALLAGR
jgi:hypothetical protein